MAGAASRGFALAAAGLLLVLILLPILLPDRRAGLPELAPAAGFALAALLAGAAFARTGPDRLGPANGITLLRLALAALLLWPLARPAVLAAAGGWAFCLVALATLALDGLDGPLARRTGTATPFGARFDMETDAIFALLLSLLVWRSGTAGVWVLLLGGLRYFYVAAMRIWPWLGGELPPSLRRKAVCVVQIGTLVALLAPVAAPPASSLAALAALGALCASFAADIRWLARRT